MDMNDSIPKQIIFFVLLFCVLLCGMLMGTGLTAKYYDSEQWRKGYAEGQKSIVTVVRAIGGCKAKENLDAVGIPNGTTPGQVQSETTPRN
jgi:hypothetical protein